MGVTRRDPVHPLLARASVAQQPEYDTGSMDRASFALPSYVESLMPGRNLLHCSSCPVKAPTGQHGAHEVQRHWQPSPHSLTVIYALSADQRCVHVAQLVEPRYLSHVHELMRSVGGAGAETWQFSREGFKAAFREARR